MRGFCSDLSQKNGTTLYVVFADVAAMSGASSSLPWECIRHGGGKRPLNTIHQVHSQRKEYDDMFSANPAR